MNQIVQDVRYALRGFARRPGFTAVALVTLALGIGGNTAVFSIVDAAFLDPLPYPDDDRMVMVYNSPRPGAAFVGLGDPSFVALRDARGAFDAVAALAPGQANIGGGDRPERVAAMAASAGLFDVTGVEPVLGRRYTAEEDAPGADGVVVISHGLWQRRYGSDPGVLGTTLQVDSRSREVVGVMPRGFEVFRGGVDVWTPLAVDEAALDRTDALNNNRAVVARLAPGVTLERAEERATAALGAVRERFGDVLEAGHAVRLDTFRAWLVGDLRSDLMVLMGAVGFVLLIACANLANLLLVRAEARRRELAVRAALGAGRGRLARQLLTESVILALAGAVLGAGVAVLALEVVRPLAPEAVPIPEAVGLDLSVLLFTAGVAVATGLTFGLAPALTVLRTDLRDTLAEGGRGGGWSGRMGLRKVLVAGEVALAAVLLVGSGLLVHSLVRLQEVDPGFRWEDRLVADVSISRSAYPTPESVRSFYETLTGRLEALAEADAVAVGQWIPLRGAVNWGFQARGATDDGVRFADYNLVGPDYFEVLGMPVLRGRAIRWSDVTSGRPVVVVSEALAREAWPDGEALGRHVNVDIGEPVWREVVGVVGDVRNRSLAAEAGAMMYFPPVELSFAEPYGTSLVVRQEPGRRLTATDIRAVIRELDPAVPVEGVSSLADVVTDSETRRRFLMTLLVAFGGVALLLAGVGLYGVVGYAVSLRTRELGVRKALGAEPVRLLAMIARESGIVVAAGLLVGLASAAALGRILSGFLFGVEIVDPVTYGGVAAFLLLAGALAIWVPARRAAAVEPSRALREG